jgi:hypothetical protein
VLASTDLTYLGVQLLPTAIDANASGGLAIRKYPDASKTFAMIGRLGQKIWEFNNAGFSTTPASAPRATLTINGNWGMSLYGSNRVSSDPAHTITEGLYFDPSTSRLYWMYGLSYDVTPGNKAVLGFTRFNADGTFATFGPWKVDIGQARARNYMTGIPSWFQASVGGRTLAIGAGLESGSGSGSWGPCLYAVDTPSETTPTSTVLTTVPLVFYPISLNGSYNSRQRRDTACTPVSAQTGLPSAGSNQFPLPANGLGFWNGSDLIRSCAWVDTPTVTGVVFGGRLAYDYGWYGQPVLPNGIKAACGNAKGQNASRYENRCFIYNAGDLANVATGATQSYQVGPTEIFDIRTRFGAPMGCHRVPTGMAFDPDTKILYALFPQGDQNAGAATPGCVLEAWQCP